MVQATTSDLMKGLARSIKMLCKSPIHDGNYDINLIFQNGTGTNLLFIEANVSDSTEDP